MWQSITLWRTLSDRNVTSVSAAGGTSDRERIGHSSIKIVIFSGVILRYLCIFNRKFELQVAFLLQFEVPPTLHCKTIGIVQGWMFNVPLSYLSAEKWRRRYRVWKWWPNLTVMHGENKEQKTPFYIEIRTSSDERTYLSLNEWMESSIS